MRMLTYVGLLDGHITIAYYLYKLTDRSIYTYNVLYIHLRKFKKEKRPFQVYSLKILFWLAIDWLLIGLFVLPGESETTT